MSKNIVIQEGGVGRNITVDKLKTAVVGGGDCLWVPEDETLLTTKTISENGTYRASDEDYYGYSEVTVNGIGTATGIGPDGNMHSVTTDNDGNLVDTIIPSSIEVTTPPTTIIYPNGYPLDFTGLVVTAYDRNGNVWTGDGQYPGGVIPVGELNIAPTTAIFDPETYQDFSATSDIEAIQDVMPIPFANTIQYKASGRSYEESASPGTAITAYQHQGNIPGEMHYVKASAEPFDDAFSYSYAGKTVYYMRGLKLGGNYDVDPVTILMTDSEWPDARYVAWTMIYGNITTGGSLETVTVTWYAPGAIEQLTTTFDVHVVPPYDDGTDTGTGGWEFDPFG